MSSRYHKDKYFSLSLIPFFRLRSLVYLSAALVIFRHYTDILATMESAGWASEASALTHAHFSSAIAMGTLAAIAVVLRIISKSHRAVGITADDICVIVALCLFWTYIGVLFWAIFSGGGGLELPNLINYNLIGVSTYIKVNDNFL